jgi:Cu-Zn family superoxide dismutase
MKRIASLALMATLLTTGIASADGTTLRTTFGLKDANGQSVGTVTLTEQSDGVLVEGTFKNLSAGTHGIHFHTVGACTPTFDAAGGHYNPTGKQHGFDNPAGAHAGDLPNLQIAANGTGNYSEVTDAITLQAGASNTLYDADGTALMIHANADDYKTDPSGNSGGRIACGVVSAAQATRLPDTGGTSATLPLLVAAATALLGGLTVRRRSHAAR